MATNKPKKKEKKQTPLVSEEELETNCDMSSSEVENLMRKIMRGQEVQ